MAAAPRALVGVPCDRKVWGDIAFHAAGEKYVTALTDAAHADPLLIPLPGLTHWDQTAIDRLLTTFDGLLFPGSPSNVDPERYGGGAPRDPDALDPARDAVTLPLIRRAVAGGVPLFAICRGIQELNAALGGTLHQAVQDEPDVPGWSPRLDHREPYGQPLAARYAPRHTVTPVPNGVLAQIIGPAPIEVNSLHSQGIDRLAPGLKAEAHAPDGLIEAVSKPGAAGFVLGVQWHPDWEPLTTPHYAALFEAFGAAARARAALPPAMRAAQPKD